MTAQSYNVVAEIDVSFDEHTAEQLLDPIADYSGAAGRSELGHTEVVFTLPAQTLRQANTTALAILETYPWPLRSLRVLPTDDYDRLVDAIDVPPLVVGPGGRRPARYQPPGRPQGDHHRFAARDPCRQHLDRARIRCARPHTAQRLTSTCLVNRPHLEDNSRPRVHRRAPARREVTTSTPEKGDTRAQFCARHTGRRPVSGAHPRPARLPRHPARGARGPAPDRYRTGRRTRRIDRHRHRRDRSGSTTPHRPAPTTVVNTLSRLVIDPERFPDAGEPANGFGRGAVYTRTCTGTPLRPEPYPHAEHLLDGYFRPYADAVTAAVEERLRVCGRAVIIDLHSYPEAPSGFEDPAAARPALCIGTDAVHTPGWLARLDPWRIRVPRRDREIGENTPYSGCYVPLRHYGRDERVTSVMIELRRDVYLTDPRTPHPERVERIGRALAVLIDQVTAQVAADV